jgi:hypothetical protein
MHEALTLLYSVTASTLLACVLFVACKRMNLCMQCCIESLLVLCSFTAGAAAGGSCEGVEQSWLHVSLVCPISRGAFLSGQKMSAGFS